MNDYNIDCDASCPKCGHEPTHYRECMYCDSDISGFNDMHEEDPINYNPGTLSMCDECYGTGVEEWCPNCGLNITEYNYKNQKSGG